MRGDWWGGCSTGGARLPKDCVFNRRKLIHTCRFGELALETRRAVISRYATARRAVRHNNASGVVNANFLREDIKVFREPRPTKLGRPHQSPNTHHQSPVPTRFQLLEAGLSTFTSRLLHLTERQASLDRRVMFGRREHRPKLPPSTY